jgi:hypothetical protein
MSSRDCANPVRGLALLLLLVVVVVEVDVVVPLGVVVVVVVVVVVGRGGVACSNTTGHDDGRSIIGRWRWLGGDGG